MFLRPFRKHSILCCHICEFKKGWYWSYRWNGHCWKGSSPLVLSRHNCRHVYNIVLCTCCEHHYKKANKGKNVTKRMNVQIDHIENTKSRDGFLKWKRKWSFFLKKGKKEKDPRVQLCHSAPPRETHFVRFTKSSWSIFPVNSWLPTRIE